jgi:hypothetical protein
MVKLLLVTVSFMVEERQGEDWDTCAFTVPYTVNEK